MQNIIKSLLKFLIFFILFSFVYFVLVKNFPLISFTSTQAWHFGNFMFSLGVAPNMEAYDSAYALLFISTHALASLLILFIVYTIYKRISHQPQDDKTKTAPRKKHFILLVAFIVIYLGLSNIIPLFEFTTEQIDKFQIFIVSLGLPSDFPAYKLLFVSVHAIVSVVILALGYQAFNLINNKRSGMDSHTT